jgi:hypothetical protein
VMDQLEPVRIMRDASRTPPKRFFRTFWRSIVCQALQREFQRIQNLNDMEE